MLRRGSGSVALAGLVLAGCGGAPELSRTARHLMLVTIDTLRADRVGALGGSVPTPHLERIARDGAIAREATTHVPLTRPAQVLRGPGVVPGLELGVTVRIVDLKPTVFGLLGLPVPVAASGQSLAGALRGGEELEEPATYAETLVPLLHFGWSDLRVLREGRDAADARYTFNLGLALLRLGHRAEARSLFEEALRLKPRFGAARERLAELESEVGG